MRKTRTQKRAEDCNAFVCRLHYVGTMRRFDCSRFPELVPKPGSNCRLNCFQCPVGEVKDCERCCYEGTSFCVPMLDKRDYMRHYYLYLTGDTRR